MTDSFCQQSAIAVQVITSRLFLADNIVLLHAYPCIIVILSLYEAVHYLRNQNC